jgi:pescadillo protein
MRKLKKALAKREPLTAERLRENEPVFNLDHIIKERSVCVYYF